MSACVNPGNGSNVSYSRTLQIIGQYMCRHWPESLKGADNNLLPVFAWISALRGYSFTAYIREQNTMYRMFTNLMPIFTNHHTLLKSAWMYPSNWSNGLSAKQFVGGSMLLSCDLMPHDSDGMVYLSPRCLGTMKASLRFAKALAAAADTFSLCSVW